MRRVSTVRLAALLLLLAAAAAQPPASALSGDLMASVCVRRALGSGAWAVPLNVRDNGDALHSFPVGEQQCFAVRPGRHELGALYWAKLNKGSTTPAATATVDLAPEDCRYFTVVMGFSGVLLRETDSERFRDEARCDGPAQGSPPATATVRH